MRTKLITLLFLSNVLFAIAQPVKKMTVINEQEVPVAIRQAFISEFGSIPINGTWTVNYNVTNEGTRTIAQPTAYTFHKKEGRSKIEVRYSPSGKLDFVKGLDKV